MNQRYFRLPNHEDIVRLKAASGVTPEEGMRLAYLTQQLSQDDNVIVEIGSRHGRSTAYIASSLRYNNIKGRIYCIDLWDLGEGITPKKHYENDPYSQFKHNLKSLGLWEYIVPVKCDSLLGAEKFLKRNQKLGEMIDFLFVDGGHKYNEVLADYMAWSRFVRPGGFIAFHDCNQQDIDQVIRENVVMSGLWENELVVKRIWSAQRQRRVT